MKWTRAGLRLLREALGEAAYRRLNRLVRDAARPLTPIRDAKVLRDTLDNVLQQAGKSAQKDRRSELRQVFLQAHRSSRDKLSNKDLNAISACLREVKRYLQDLPDSRLDHAPTDAALFPGGLRIAGRESILQSFGDQPWESFSIEDTHVIALTANAVTLTYKAKAKRAGTAQYAALISSTYVFDRTWQLVIHQQTPAH